MRYAANLRLDDMEHATADGKLFQEGKDAVFCVVIEK